MPSFRIPGYRLAVLSILVVFLAACGDSGGGGDDTTQQVPLAATASVSVAGVTVPADADEATFTVSLAQGSDEVVSVGYRTEPMSAEAGEDYVHTEGRLAFAPGETVKHVFVTLLRDGDGTAVTEFALVLSGPERATLGNDRGVATLAVDAMVEEAAFDPAWDDVGVFSAGSNCTRCHRASDSAPGVMTHAGEDVSPSAGWRHSLMAQSFADPYFQAAVADEVAHTPALAGAIEDSCLTCHAPMGRTNAHQTGTALDTDGFYRFETALEQMHAREGVSCTVCHQIQDDGSLGTALSFSGQYAISSGAARLFGPYPSPVTRPMENNTQYVPVHGAQMQDSGLCATCHTLFTPTLHVDTGEPTGESFPEQTPYLEWQNSVYASGRSAEAHCQDCHMPQPAAGYATQIAVRPNGSAGPDSWPERSPFHRHDFVGGNAHTLELLQSFRTVLGIEGNTSPEGFDAKIAATRAHLAEGTALVNIDGIATDGEILSVDVRITNLTGHKLPTSYPSRRMWLHLRVADGSGATIFESGRPDAYGRLASDGFQLQEACLESHKDDDEFDYDACYEAHHDVIDSPEQTAIYESVLGDVHGHITYVLLHARRYLKDNRLPPRGFVRAAVPADGVTAITGEAAADADFNAEAGGLGSGEDRVHYRIDPEGHPGPYAVEAELMYQAVRPAFVETLHAEDDPRIARYKQMVEQIPPSVEILATAQASY